jgi:hypothetical protein
MKLERSNVEFPIWRKKVDKSLFEHNGTTVPEWACRMWGLAEFYGEIASRRDTRAQAKVVFNKTSYPAWVTVATKGRVSPAFRLWYDPTVSLELKNVFLMSYMRMLEGALEADVDVETTIPFWEFLDIEFDRANRIFYFVAYYTVTPSFPALFKRLIGSPSVRNVEDEIANKDLKRIHKQNWKPRSELQFELGARNVIYTLMDSKAKLIYIGEAADLIKRLQQPHNSISSWDFFRYNVLPGQLFDYRVALERMLIRDFASLLDNKKEIEWRDVSGCQLANDRIDR